MAREVRSFAALIPAGTPQAAPVTVDCSFPERVVAGITWRVPPGPSGLMGWRVTMGGAQVLPAAPGTWIVADDQTDDWPLTGQPDSGAWQVQGYNTGSFDHTVYLDFLLDLVPVPGAPAAAVAGGASSLTGLTGQADLTITGG